MAKNFGKAVNVANTWFTGDKTPYSQTETTQEKQSEKESGKETVAKSSIINDEFQNSDEKEISDESEKKIGKKSVTKKDSASVKKVKSESNQLFTIVGQERKTRQTSLLLKESTYTKLEALSKQNGISINSCINQILEQVLI